MKTTKKICHVSFIMFCLTFSVKKNNAQTISDHYFGINAWMPDTVGNVNSCPDPPCYKNGKLHKNWQKIKDSNASIIRYGGIAADKNMPTNFQYIRVIDSIRAFGMEPIIQVPFYDNRYTASQAAAIVNYINVVKGKQIKYWIIGNEPDLSYPYTTASQIANYIRPFSSAMKNIDPSILIIGPECAWFNNTIYNGLTSPGGPDDITGKDPAGRYYVDVISFHTYPFNGSQTRSQVISKLTDSGSLEDDLIYLNSRINAANTFHNRTGASKLKTAITEANINWQNSSSDNLNGLGVNSFIGGQFVAEMMGIGLEQGLDFINIWSVIEGNATALNIGYLNNSNGNKKPLYYHFELMAEKFKGNIVNCTSNQFNVKVFGSKDNASQTCVLILNEELSANHNYTVRLNTTGITGSDPLKINVDAGIAVEYTDVMQNQSSQLLTFNSAGALMQKCEYSLAGHAIANLPPTCMDFVITDISSNSISSEEFLDISIFPNPTLGKFYIELNTANSEKSNFEITIINILGQEVYRKKLPFINGKEEIELPGAIGQGAYILTVKEKNNRAVKRIILNK